MKKIILLALLFVAFSLNAQNPQIFPYGVKASKFIKTLPTGSTVGDSVLLDNGKSKALSAIKTDTTKLSARIDLKENLSNKSTSVATDGASDIKYPSVKSVKTYVDGNFTGLTQNSLTKWNGSKLVNSVIRQIGDSTVLIDGNIYQEYPVLDVNGGFRAYGNAKIGGNVTANIFDGALGQYAYNELRIGAGYQGSGSLWINWRDVSTTPITDYSFYDGFGHGASVSASQFNGSAAGLTGIKTINGNSILGTGDLKISSGGGGGGVNVYLSNTNSPESGYKTSTAILDASETVKTITTTANNTIQWGEKYLYTSPVATTILPAGFWSLHLFGSINSNTGVTQVVFRVFKYNGGTETTIYTVTGYETNQTSDGEIVVGQAVPEATVLTTDYIGFQIGLITNSTPKTLTYTLGNGHATYTTNPLPLRHSALRDKNGESDFQHLTAAQVSVVNATSGSNTGDETLSSIKTKLGAATGSSDGYLKYQDFNTFNEKQNSLTNPVTGTGTTNYLSKFTGTSTLGNSLIYDNGTNVGIGTTNPTHNLEIGNGTGSWSQEILAGNGSSAALYLTTSGGQSWNLNTQTNNNFAVWDNTNSKQPFTIEPNTPSNTLYLNSTGNVSIGTVTPSEKLEVNGNIKATSFVKSGGTSSQYLMADGSTTIAGVTCGDASTTVVSSTNIGSVNIIYHTYTAIGNQVTEYITLSGTPVITGLFDVSVAPQFTPLTSQTFLGTGISTIVGSSSVSAIATTGASSSSIVCTCYGGVAGVTNVVSIVVQYKK